MRTRRGGCYPKVDMFSDRTVVVKRLRDFSGDISCPKRVKMSMETRRRRDLFEELPDDLILCVLCRLSSTASCPADFINVLIT